MAERDPTGYARRNGRALAVLFAGALVFGLVRGNPAALLGGAGGLAWVGWAVTRPE